jgi:hypothetical protein
MATTRPKLKSNRFVTEAEVSRKHQISARRLGRPVQLKGSRGQRLVKVQNPR